MAAEPGGRTGRQLIWPMLFWALLAGAGFSLLGPLVAPQHGSETAVGAAIAAGCLLLAAVIRAVPDRLPIWLAHAVLALATIGISAEVYTNHRASDDDEVFYLWVAMFAFYFFSRPAALVHMALIGVSYWLAIFARGDAVPEDRLRWLVTITTLTAAGLVVQHLVRRQDGMIARLGEAARTDPLTGLLNRKGFNEAFASQLAMASRRGESFALIIGDLDRFKQVNDRMGHAAGDRTLETVAALLERSTRGGDRPARLGGEEFAVLAADADVQRATTTAERLRATIERELADAEVPVTISFGVAVYPDDGTTPNELMVAADRALYRAKDEGRNRTVLYAAGRPPSGP